MTSILIVDDHRHLAENLATTIPWAERGVSLVLQAYSGPEALDALRMLAPDGADIVITDIRMPAMSGLELVRIVRETYPDTDCLLLTGYAEFEYARQAMELGAAGYLMKPVRESELAEAVLRLLEKRAARQAERSEAERLRRTVRSELPRLRADLLAAQAAAERAAEAERARIAGDLHDIVGYTLTAMIVQIEAASKQLAKDRREEGMSRLANSALFARRSLNDIRETLGHLRLSDPEGAAPPVLADLKDAVEQFLDGAAHTVGIALERRISLPGAPDDPDLVRALLHVLQEGITNGIRHGGAERFVVELTDTAGELRLALWNDGNPAPAQATPGTGLAAMAERLARWGGRASLVPTAQPDGSLLTVLLPWPNEARADGPAQL
ncbi:response regulator [Cohnella sp. 56]|uniref:response regulator n=1 Tax=Cohnella sp. 56 TaxID=3113722 RepID=UPI0030E89D67